MRVVEEDDKIIIRNRNGKKVLVIEKDGTVVVG
jgi:hypothetical protein